MYCGYYSGGSSKISPCCLSHSLRMIQFLIINLIYLDLDGSGVNDVGTAYVKEEPGLKCREGLIVFLRLNVLITRIFCFLLIDLSLCLNLS